MTHFSVSSLRARLILMVLVPVIPALGAVFYCAQQQRLAAFLLLVSGMALAGAWWGGEWLVIRKVDHLIAATERAALERANKDLSRKEQIQALLKEVNQDVTKLDPDALLKKLTGKVCEFFKVDVSDVRIFKDKQWSVLGISGVDPQLFPTIRHGSSNRRSRWIIEHKKPCAVSDITSEESHPRGGTMRSLGLRAYLGVPLISRNGEVVGVLRALSYQQRAFMPEEIELMQLIANGAAVALENASLLEQIKLQAEDLEKANRVKDEFLGFVSHELKTPVNLIRGYTELIDLIGGLKPEQEQAIKKVIKSSEELVSMINTLLEATKIEIGAVQVHRSKMDLGSFLDELQSRYQVPLDKNLSIRWNYSKDLPAIVSDREKLKHVLQNLLDNAIKYSEEGCVTLSAWYRVEAREVVFKVDDTGIGIPPPELSSIFDMFRQVSVSIEKSSGGVGLGLYIVKTFVELLGGEVTVESELDKGSSFTVVIPAASEPMLPVAGLAPPIPA